MTTSLNRRHLLTGAASAAVVNAAFLGGAAPAAAAAATWTKPRLHALKRRYTWDDDPQFEHDEDMAAAGCTYQGGPSGFFSAPSLQEGDRLLTSGVLRFHRPQDGPYLHVNTAHAALGIRGLERHGGDLLIHTDTALSGKWAIAYPPCIPDESLSVRGIACGISGGMGMLRVRFAIQTVNGPRTLSVLDPRLYDPKNDLVNLWFAAESVKRTRSSLR